MINAAQDLSPWLETSEPQPVDDPPSPSPAPAPQPQPDQGGSGAE